MRGRRPVSSSAVERRRNCPVRPGQDGAALVDYRQPMPKKGRQFQLLRVRGFISSVRHLGQPAAPRVSVTWRQCRCFPPMPSTGRPSDANSTMTRIGADVGGDDGVMAAVQSRHWMAPIGSDLSGWLAMALSRWRSLVGRDDGGAAHREVTDMAGAQAAADEDLSSPPAGAQGSGAPPEQASGEFLTAYGPRTGSAPARYLSSFDLGMSWVGVPLGSSPWRQAVANRRGWRGAAPLARSPT